MFNFLRNCQTVFKAAVPFSIPTSNEPGFQCLHIPVNSGYCGLKTFFKILAILVGVKWYPIAILTHIYLVTNDGKHLFMCLLAICVSSLQKCLFWSFAYFKIGLLFFIVEL